ncbi:hypothetical protein ACMFMG_004509 [Clarireedia jacksonii]
MPTVSENEEYGSRQTSRGQRSPPLNFINCIVPGSGRTPTTLMHTPFTASSHHQLDPNSYQFSFRGVRSDEEDSNSKTWMYKRDADEQMARIIDAEKKPLVTHFKNRENIIVPHPATMCSQVYSLHCWLHAPLIPDRQTTWQPKEGNPPLKKGAVRALWSQGSKDDYIVIYHDPDQTEDTSPKKCIKAAYHPAARPTDGSSSGTVPSSVASGACVQGLEREMTSA